MFFRIEPPGAVLGLEILTFSNFYQIVSPFKKCTQNHRPARCSRELYSETEPEAVYLGPKPGTVHVSNDTILQPKFCHNFLQNWSLIQKKWMIFVRVYLRSTETKWGRSWVWSTPGRAKGRGWRRAEPGSATRVISSNRPCFADVKDNMRIAQEEVPTFLPNALWPLLINCLRYFSTVVCFVWYL